jgi:transposase
VDRAALQGFLDEGLSLERIAGELDVHHSTVANSLKKHGLRAAHSERFAPKGPPERARLAELAGSGASLAEIARELGRSIATVRYWLERWGIQRPSSASPRRPDDPENASPVVELRCRRHGLVAFRLEGRGYYRCTRCRQDYVTQWRRKVKRVLVAEAGGCCVLCGYDRCAAALEFHHVDPTAKAFGLSDDGVARSLDRARAEAAKCVLLCANCHVEVERGVRTLPAPRGGFEPPWPD